MPLETQWDTGMQQKRYNYVKYLSWDGKNKRKKPILVIIPQNEVLFAWKRGNLTKNNQKRNPGENMFARVLLSGARS